MLCFKVLFLCRRGCWFARIYGEIRPVTQMARDLAHERCVFVYGMLHRLVLFGSVPQNTMGYAIDACLLSWLVACSSCGVVGLLPRWPVRLPPSTVLFQTVS